MSTATLLGSPAALARLEFILAARQPIGFDSEGLEWPTCLGFATSASRVLVIDTLVLRGHSRASEFWALMQAIIESPDVLKVCWQASHEREFLAHALHWRMRCYTDAMFAWHERWPDMRKGLKYAASHLTRFPCWTAGISWSDDDDRPAAAGPLLWTYNAHDCAATLAIHQHPQLQLTQAEQARCDLNLRLIEPFTWASLKGVRYDQAAADAIRARLTPKLWEAQAKVDAAAGIVLPPDDALLEHARTSCCVKRAVAKGLVKDWAGAARHAKKPFREPLKRVLNLLAEPSTPARQGELGSLLKLSLNVKSTPVVISTLNRLGLPPIFKRGAKRAAPAGNANEDAASNEVATPSQTKDASALLALFLRTGHPITTALLETIAIRGRLQELDRVVDPDGRIRSSYTICGPATDRTASHKWLTGSGGNVQTVPREPENFRVCYTADPGHDWFKLDLTGADLWTVAARVAEQGDPTMLLDLRAGIRIPSLVGLMIEHDYRPGLDRAAIKADCVAYRAALKAKGESWKDTVWKKAGHLTNYKGSHKRIRQSVIEDTYAETGTPIDPGAALCQRTQQIYLSRYWGVPKWWARTGDTIMRNEGRLTYATGRVREFITRRPSRGVLDDETRRQALAAEPQHITTHVIKVGLDRLWRDPENWPGGNPGEGLPGERDPYIQPLIPCVHDECTGQYPSDRRAWAVAKLRSWFTVPLVIGREAITIPFDGATGPSWGACKESL